MTPVAHAVAAVENQNQSYTAWDRQPQPSKQVSLDPVLGSGVERFRGIFKIHPGGVLTYDALGSGPAAESRGVSSESC